MPAQVWGGVCLVLVLAGVAGVGVSVPLALRANPGAGLLERLDTARTLLTDTPLVDGWVEVEVEVEIVVEVEGRKGKYKNNEENSNVRGMCNGKK